MGNKIPIRDRVAILTAVAFVLGGGVGSLMALAYIIGRRYPQLNQPGVMSDIWIPVGLAIGIFCVILGSLLGSILWLLVMKSWLPREQLKQYFTQPYVPIISPILLWLFNLFYREKSVGS